jgi:hypothetical protein
MFDVAVLLALIIRSSLCEAEPADGILAYSFRTPQYARLLCCRALIGALLRRIRYR